jgi:hypothetical protein
MGIIETDFVLFFCGRLVTQGLTNIKLFATLLSTFEQSRNSVVKEN